MPIVHATPIETFKLNGRAIRVKREDLSCPDPGPSFSKLRGVWEHIAARPETTIGVLDTFHSKAGWGVAYVCRELGKKCVVYWPLFKREIYSDGAYALREPQRRAKLQGAKLVALPAGRSAILYHSAKKQLAETTRGKGYLMPNALKLVESVAQTAAEVGESDRRALACDHLIISVSSGTIAAGVIRGFLDRKLYPKIWLHMGYSRSHDALIDYLREKIGDGFADILPNIQLVDEGYAYKDRAPATATAPFPCNPYYDLKTWSWMEKSFNEPGRVLFWNIGA